MTQVTYATRGDVMRALDMAETARADRQILRDLQTASRSVEQLTRRLFYPTVATRYFDWPNFQHTYSWKLYLDHNELISADSITTAGIALTVGSDVLLEPVNDGPPYTWIEINLARAPAFAGASTRQRSIVIAGTFGGCPVAEVATCALDGLITSSVTTIDITDVADVPPDIGDLIRVDDERMIVTGQSVISTGQSLATPITSSTASTAVAVSDGTAFAIDEVIELDTERMLVVDILANTLVVRRAWDGSVLASHTGSTVYAVRRLTVERGALGTAATAHLDTSVIHRYLAPALVRELTIAETVNTLQGEQSAYARDRGAGSAARPRAGDSLDDLRQRVMEAHGRQMRTSAI